MNVATSWESLGPRMPLLQADLETTHLALARQRTSPLDFCSRLGGNITVATENDSMDPVTPHHHHSFSQLFQSSVRCVHAVDGEVVRIDLLGRSIAGLRAPPSSWQEPVQCC